MAIGQELLNVPMGQMIQSMALAIAAGQAALDNASIRTAELMSGKMLLRDSETGKLLDTSGKDSKEPAFVDSRVYFGYVYDIDKTTKEPRRVPMQVSMMELGFTPNFYQFIDTIIEVKISISITKTTEDTKTSVSNTTKEERRAQPAFWAERTNANVVSTAQVNGAYSAKYGYSAEGSSLLRTKLVPVPPPALLEERIREVMGLERAFEQWKLLSDLRDTMVAELAKDKDTLDEKARVGRQADIDAMNVRIIAALDGFGARA